MKQQATIQLVTGGANRALVVQAPACADPVEYRFAMGIPEAVDLIFRLMEEPVIAAAVVEQSRATLAEQKAHDEQFLRAAGVTDAS